MTSGTLSVEQMLEEASAATGLSDFGPEEFKEALTQWVDSTNRDVVFNAMGELIFKSEVHRILVNRARLAEDLKRHPEILDEDVSDPIIILGLPRSGSTKMQRVLAADPNSLGLRFWQLVNPAPFPEQVSAGAEDPRIQVGREAIAAMAQMAPGFLQSHPITVDDVDEEAFLQFFSFKSLMNYCLHPAHGYFEWLSKQSLRGTYEYMKVQLQYLQWQMGGKRGRPWMLKSPVNMAHLDLLIEFFPAAKFVFTHRPLDKVIPSFCRLTEMSWRMKTDAIDMKQIGEISTAIWSTEIRKHLRQREELGNRIDIIDIQYDAIRDDPIAAAGEIYRRFGRELTPQCVQAMKDWATKDAYGHFGEYSYSLEDYGLSKDAIESQFSEYIQKFYR